MKLLELFLLLILSTLVSGHGKMTKPLSRFGPGYQDDPIGFPSNIANGNNIPEYVCRQEAKRHDQADPDWTAGSVVSVHWDFGAAHVGDCEGYISYDHGKARTEMTWIKIANWPDCKADNRQDVPMKLPSWLPDGKAVFRFHWYALHVRPTIEWYTQCADVVIHSEQKTWPTGLDSFTLINPPLFPSDGLAYRNAFEGQHWMTGPSCSAPTGMINTDNECDLTAPGATPGWLDVTTGEQPDIVVPDDDGGNNDDNDDDNNDDHNPTDPKICPSNTFVSVNHLIAPDSWCQAHCTWSIDDCEPEVCACHGGYQSYAVPSVEITTVSSGITPTWRVIYIDWRIGSWTNLYTDIKNAADAGFNVIILAFHMGLDHVTNGERIADAAQVWRDMTAQQRTQTKTYLAAKNARLLVSMGGETMSFEDEIDAHSAQHLCTSVGQWAIDYQLDGVDVDMELEPGHQAPFHDESAINWLVTCTKALRTKLGDEMLISHAPLAPYFGSWAGSKRGYLEVYKQAPTINILNIQYYNQGDWVYTTYQDLFVKNDFYPGTAIKELLDAGIPEHKLVVGKPVYGPDASNGHVDPVDLRSWGSKACNDMNWSAGFMGWQYRPEIVTHSFASELTNTICVNVAATPMLGASLTAPLHQPNDEPANEGSTGTSGWVVFAGILGGLIAVALIGYIFYWRSTLQGNVYKTNLVDQNYENMNKV